MKALLNNKKKETLSSLVECYAKIKTAKFRFIRRFGAEKKIASSKARKIRKGKIKKEIDGREELR